MISPEERAEKSSTYVCNANVREREAHPSIKYTTLRQRM
jgi:hypothetical protein